MKFMQRAAASATSTPDSESDAPSSKKRKLGHRSKDDEYDLNIDQATIQAAIDDREAKRQAALERHGGNDTYWVLNTSLEKPGQLEEPRKIVYVGYGDLDPSDDESETNAKIGRTSTKDYKKAKTVCLPQLGRTRLSANPPQKPGEQEESQSEDESEDEDDEDEDSPGRQSRSNGDTPSSKQSRSRSQSRSRPSAESLKAKEFRDKRKKKDVHVNKLTSISSAGASQFGSSASQSKGPMICHKCQQQGHKAMDCPQRSAKGSKGSSKRG